MNLVYKYVASASECGLTLFPIQHSGNLVDRIAFHERGGYDCDELSELIKMVHIANSGIEA